MKALVPAISRRRFIRTTTQALTAAGVALELPPLLAQTPGERPTRAEGVTVLNPRGRVPVGLIIDDSTCLVNLNRFAMPQFDEAFAAQGRRATSATGASGRRKFRTLRAQVRRVVRGAGRERQIQHRALSGLRRPARSHVAGLDASRN